MFSRNCQFYGVTYILFDLFYRVSLPMVFDMITCIKNKANGKLKSRSFDLAVGRIDCTVIQCIES